MFPPWGASLFRADDTIDRRTRCKFPDDATIAGAYGLGIGITTARLILTAAFGRTRRSGQQFGASPAVAIPAYDRLDSL